MTDYTKLTNVELDRKLAELMGWSWDCPDCKPHEDGCWRKPTMAQENNEYCVTCTNPRETDCQYCYKGSRFEHEEVVIHTVFTPTVTVVRSVKKVDKYGKSLLPFLSE